MNPTTQKLLDASESLATPMHTYNPRADALKGAPNQASQHTPRTNEALFRFNESKGDVVSADFARDLERENADLRASLPSGPMKPTQRFPVGTQFKPIGKNASLCTVTDFLVTRNLAGDVVKTCYVSEHTFLGQTLINRDVCEATIVRATQS